MKRVWREASTNFILQTNQIHKYSKSECDFFNLPSGPFELPERFQWECWTWMQKKTDFDFNVFYIMCVRTKRFDRGLTGNMNCMFKIIIYTSVSQQVGHGAFLVGRHTFLIKKNVISCTNFIKKKFKSQPYHNKSIKKTPK